MHRIAVLAATAFIDALGVLVVVPLLPFYALRSGGSGHAIGILIAAYAVAQLGTAPLWGRFSDRFGRRPILLCGIAVSALAYCIFANADSLQLLLLSRLVQGVGGGSMGVLQAWAADASAPDQRARALGWLSAAGAAGVATGPLLGSVSQELGPAAPGYVAAGLCGVNFAFAWLVLREAPGGSAAAAPAPPRIRELVRDMFMAPGTPAPRLVWTYAAAVCAFQVMTAVLALFLAARHGITERTIGYLLAYVGGVAVLARAVVLGRVVHRLGEVRTSRIGLALMGAGFLLIPLTHGLPSLLAAVALMPVGTALALPSLTSLLTRATPEHGRGVSLGVQQSFGGGARVVGPLYAGWSWDYMGVSAPFWSAAVLVACALCFGIGWWSLSATEHPRASVDHL